MVRCNASCVLIDMVWRSLLRVQEIGEHLMTLLGQDRLGMELHALHGELAMAHAHDLAVLAFGGHLQTLGKPGAVDDQRMIACGGQGVVEPGENTVSVMAYGRELAVHDAPGANDAPSECLADRLVAQANAEDRDLAGEALNQRHRDARFRWRARSG